MATRRSRIKGIANIPLRKKTTNETEKDFIETPQTQNDLGNLADSSINSTANDQEYDSNVTFNTDLKQVSSGICVSEQQTAKTSVVDIEKNENVVPILEQKEIQEKKPIVMRRKHLKPMVSASVINKKSKTLPEETNLDVVNTPIAVTGTSDVKEIESATSLEKDSLSSESKNSIAVKGTQQEDLQVGTILENNQSLQIVNDSQEDQTKSLAKLDGSQEDHTKTLVQQKNNNLDTESSFKQDNTHILLPVIIKKHTKPSKSVQSSTISSKAPQDDSLEKESLPSNNSNTLDNEEVAPTFLKPISETSEYQKQNGRQIKSKADRKNSTESKEESQVTLNEICLTYHSDLPPVTPVEISYLKKPITIVTGNQSDIEYPPPPPSPSKINRSRIKAIPKLNYRKTSFSASESEDEARKSNSRIRNDSVCSTASGIIDSVLENTSFHKSREINSIIQKKCTRSDQTRKLAEARREFQRRFGNNKPDRQRLTMMDLIFYNPETNPIIKEKSKVKPNNVEENIEDEKVDDLPQEDDKASSDEENDIPGPQVKIGPSGEIILDEKSLVIERKELNKKKEELQKSEIVNGDFDTGYGIYKKQKRSKSWTSSETLRFYKALNSIGTDFALMCELFPNRTRREIKMKFKKEERINRTLIDKALMQPCSFDYEELKHEMDMEQKENEELERQKEESKKLKRQMKLEKPRKRKSTEQIKEELVVPKKPRLRTLKKTKQKDKLNFENLLNENDADESDIQTQSESEDELIVSHRPTRSGRVPKVPDKYQAEESLSLTSIIGGIKKKINSVETDILNQENKDQDIEPGSIMIMCEKGPSDEPVYKIFMVTPEQHAAPLKLAPDAIARAIKFKTGMAAKNILTISAVSTDDEDDSKETLPIENNITIPADETVTTLRNFATTDDGIELNATSLDVRNITIVEDNNVTTLRNHSSTQVELNDNSLDESTVAMQGDETMTFSQNKSVMIIKSECVLPDPSTTNQVQLNDNLLHESNVIMKGDEDVSKNKTIVILKTECVSDNEANINTTDGLRFRLRLSEKEMSEDSTAVD